MSDSQVISFRAAGAFLRWLESSRVLDESTSQAASRLLRSFASSHTGEVQPLATAATAFYSGGDVQPFAVTQPPDRFLALSQSDITLMFPLSDSADSSATIQDLQAQLEELRSQLQAVSEVRLQLKDSVVDFESQLELGRADYEELETLLESTKADVLSLEAENAQLKETIAKFVAVPQFDSSLILNKLRASNKKSAASLADVQFVIEQALEQLNFF